MDIPDKDTLLTRLKHYLSVFDGPLALIIFLIMSVCGLAPYATYDIFVSHPGFISTYLENVPIFDSTVSIQSVEMLPTVSGEQNPNVINESV